MDIRVFMRKNKKEIDNHIRSVCPNCGYITIDERRQQIYNDLFLYSWAQSENVCAGGKRI